MYFETTLFLFLNFEFGNYYSASKYFHLLLENFSFRTSTERFMNYIILREMSDGLINVFYFNNIFC